MHRASAMREGCGTRDDGAVDAGVHPGAHAEDGLAEDVRPGQPGPRERRHSVAQPCIAARRALSHAPLSALPSGVVDSSRRAMSTMSTIGLGMASLSLFTEDHASFIA